MDKQSQITISTSEDAVTIIGGGSLDLTNSAEFHKGLREAALSANGVVVDMSRAVFIDTAIVQDLAMAAVTLIGRGKRLKVVVSETAYPRRVIKISGIDTLMDIEVVSSPTEQNEQNE